MIYLILGILRRDGWESIPGKDQVGPGIRGDGDSGRSSDLAGTGWVLGCTGHLGGIRKMLGLIRDQLDIRQKAGGSWNDRWGRDSGAGGNGVNPRISGASAGDPVRPKHLGNHAG